MSVIIKLTDRGNATGVSIPRVLLREMQWLVGDYLIVERNGDELRIFRAGDLTSRPRPVKQHRESIDA